MTSILQLKTKTIPALKRLQKHIGSNHEMSAKLKSITMLIQSHVDLEMPFYSCQYDEVIRILKNWGDAAEYRGDDTELRLIEDVRWSA